MSPRRAGSPGPGEEVVRSELKYPSPAAAVTIDVLVALVASQPAGVGLRQLSLALGVPRSTLHRILLTLEAKGMVRRLDGVGYLIGEALEQLGIRHRVSELPRLAQPVLRDVHERTGETVNLAIPHDEAMLIIAAVQSVAPLRMVSAEGMRDLLHASALGKSYLAALPDAELHETLRRIVLVRSTRKTITDREGLLEDIRRVRMVGYAVDDGESSEGVRCVGAVIRAAGERPVGAMSVSAPASRLSQSMTRDVGLLVVRAAANISGLLGSTGSGGSGTTESGASRARRPSSGRGS